MDGTYRRRWNSLGKSPCPHCFLQTVVSSLRPSRPNSTHHCLVGWGFVPECCERCAVVILVWISSIRKTHCSEIQWALLLCFQGATFLTVRKPFLMLTLHCSHQAWTFARNFLSSFFRFGLLWGLSDSNSLTRDQTLKSPNHWAARESPTMDSQYGPPPLPTFQLGPLDIYELTWRGGGVTPEEEIPAKTLLCSRWIRITATPSSEWGKAKKPTPWLFGVEAKCRDQITKWSLFFDRIEDALFNGTLSKPIFVPFYPPLPFVLFNFLLLGIKSFLFALCAPSTSILASLPYPFDIYSKKNYPAHSAVESQAQGRVQLLEYITMTLFQVASKMPVLAASFKKLFIFTKVYNSIFIVYACDLGTFFSPCQFLIIIQHWLQP